MPLPGGCGQEELHVSALPELGDSVIDGNYHYCIGSPSGLPLSLRPAHAFLRDPCSPSTHNAPPHTHTLASSLTPWGWTGGCWDTALASFLHTPPAKELPPAFRSINNKPGT